VNRACETCLFWQRHTYAHPSVVHAGHCHRNPPTVLLGPDEAFAAWPETDRTDWCGRWEEKP
jgi:hypothetical protein